MSKFKVGDLIRELPGSNSPYCITAGSWVGEVTAVSEYPTLTAITKTKSDTTMGVMDDRLDKEWNGLEPKYFELVPPPPIVDGVDEVAKLKRQVIFSREMFQLILKHVDWAEGTERGELKGIAVTATHAIARLKEMSSEIDT